MPTELEEALTAASAVTPLIQKQIDPLLLEYQRRYSPLLRALPAKQWGSTQYFFNRRVNRPDAGGVLDGGARPIGNSVYEQAVFNIRLYQAVGSVTGFAQTVTRDLVGDLRQLEIDGTMQSMLWTLENAFVWGHDGATAAGQYPISTGLDYLVGNFAQGTGSNAFVNALQYTSGTNSSFNGATFALKYLDEVMDLVETNAGMPVDGGNWMFVMSPRMASSLSQLLVSQQRFMDKVEVAAGLNVPTYRDVPIIKSSFLSPRSTVMSTVTATPSASGGSLATATYNYAVSAVVARFGETAAVSVSSGAVTGPTGSVSLSFSTPTGLPDNATPILYKVYRSTGTAIPQLIGVVDAFDTTGAATTTIVDTGTNLLTNSSGNTGPSGYQGVGAGGVINGTGTSAYLPRPTTGPVEDIYLIPRDPNFLVRPYTRDMQVIPLAPTVTAPDTLPFALVTDTALAVRGPKYVGRASGLVSSI